MKATVINMVNRTKIAVIGGDSRQLVAAERLRAAGFDTALYGFDIQASKKTEHENSFGAAVDAQCCSEFDCRELPSDIAKKINSAGTLCETPDEAISNALAVMLPLPAISEGSRISMPLAHSDNELTIGRICGMMAARGVKKLCAGKLGRDYTAMCEGRGLEVFDYYEREEFSVANAIPTAEGAVAIAMNELSITLHGSSALVVGYGRIGKVLSRMLKGLGVKVTVSARKASDFAWIKAEGCDYCHTGRLAELFHEKRFDVIFNTIPYMVIGRDELARIPSETLIIDLASKPGGIDIPSAKEFSQNVIWALSLPGKVAPITSGQIIADTIIGYLNGAVT